MKTPPFQYLLICCILPLLALKCKAPVMDRRYPLYVENKSTHDIVSLLGFGKNRMLVYPDTSVPDIGPIADSFSAIVPGEQRRIWDGSGPWEEMFRSYLQADTFSVFIFHSDTLRKYSWDEVRINYKVLKRYDLSLEELKRMNYVLTYP